MAELGSLGAFSVYGEKIVEEDTHSPGGNVMSVIRQAEKRK